MALLTMDAMVNELNRRMGIQDELLLNQVGSAPLGSEYNVIERALNDAYVQSILRYKHTEFEADKPFVFDNLATTDTDGVNAAGAGLITSSNAAIGLEPDGSGDLSTLDRWCDGAFALGGTGNSSGCHTIIKVTDVGGNTTPPYTAPFQIFLAPVIPVASPAGGSEFVMAARRYPLPFTDGDGAVSTPPNATDKRIFFVYDVTDISNNVPLVHFDVRMSDRSVPVISQPNYWDRLKNDLFIHPAPFFTLPEGAPGPMKLRVRFAYRPGFKTGTDTFSPLPEEWQEVVMLEAYAKLLDEENEHERGQATRASADELAQRILVPFYEEMDDAEPAFIPLKRRR